MHGECRREGAQPAQRRYRSSTYKRATKFCQGSKNVATRYSHSNIGAGESGKSTILKQMKLIHDSGYSAEEKEAFKEIIFSNTVQSMRVILEAMETMSIAFGSDSAEEYKNLIMDLPAQMEADVFPSDVCAAIKGLWADTGVQECFLRAREFQLNDSAS